MRIPDRVANKYNAGVKTIALSPNYPKLQKIILNRKNIDDAVIDEIEEKVPRLLIKINRFAW